MNLQITHLHSPYETLVTQRGRDFFGSILSFRLESYQKRYGDNVFPFGAEDFLSQVIAIRDQDSGETLASFKYVTYQDCEKFNQEFPIFHTLGNPNNPRELYQSIKSKFLADGPFKRIAYMGSFTISSQDELSIPERRLLKEVIITSIVGIVKDNKTNEVIVTGTIPNGSSNFIQSMGFQKLSETPVQVRDIGSTSAHLLSWTYWSPLAEANFKRHFNLWREREVIAPSIEKALAA